MATYGYIQSVGIHHKNQYNHFNLADDIIEPFRPLADLFVLTHSIEERLTPKQKYELVKILQINTQIDQQKFALEHAIHMVVESFNKAVHTNDVKYLKLPVLLDINLHTYE